MDVDCLLFTVEMKFRRKHFDISAIENSPTKALKALKSMHT